MNVLLRLSICWLALPVSSFALAAPDPDALFDTCADEFRAAPEIYESSLCFYASASATGHWTDAGQHLRALEAEYPKVVWLKLVHGYVEANIDPAAAEATYRKAAIAFAAQGNIRGELLARSNLQLRLSSTGRIADAAAEVDRVIALGERASDPELKIRARLLESWHFMNTGRNLGRALRALQDAESVLTPAHSYWLRSNVLIETGNLYLLFAEFRKADNYFTRARVEAAANDDLSGVALAEFNIANTMLEQQNERPAVVDPERLLDTAHSALAAAKRAGNSRIELLALRLLGEILVTDDPEAAAGHTDECLRRAEALEERTTMSQCLWIRARLLAETDPQRAQGAIKAAIDLLDHTDGVNYRLLAYAWRHSMRIGWLVSSATDAIAGGERALSAIEKLRDLQAGTQSRTAAFAAWTGDYYWQSGQILRLAESAADPGVLLNQAFRTTERMRARTLLEQLRSEPDADVLSSAQLHETQQQRDEQLRAIVEINRQLLRTQDASRTEALLARLDLIERSELGTREVLTRPAILAPAQLASLSEIQSALTTGEALISFQVGLWQAPREAFAGGSWVLLVTSEQARAFRIPGRETLEQSVAMYLGMIRADLGVPKEAREALYDQLLREAIATLPPRIKRLIVIPDSPLHGLPLASLGDDRGPIAGRYEIVFAPSANVWLHWQQQLNLTFSRPALVFANPQIEAASSATSQFRAWSIGNGAVLGALPYAEVEGRNVLRRVRGDSLLWSGPDATELALKTAPIADFGVLHFAAHAVIDETHPDRSAIVLAPGSEAEDGLLQVREIADLTLNGQLVVLSACQSATGSVVRGEGVLGLARAFLAAGASGVIGSLWPMRDDHAQAFFEPFYTALAQGASVGGALHDAQRRLIADGLPVAAWAGFVLLGNPDAVPVLAQPATSGVWRLITGGAVALLLIALIMAFRRYRI